MGKNETCFLDRPLDRHLPEKVTQSSFTSTHSEKSRI